MNNPISVKIKYFSSVVLSVMTAVYFSAVKTLSDTIISTQTEIEPAQEVRRGADTAFARTYYAEFILGFILVCVLAILIFKVLSDAKEKEREAERLEKIVSERTQLLQEKNRQLSRMNEDIIEFMGNIVEARDVESGEHIKRVKGFTYILAGQVMRDCPKYRLTPDKIRLIASASVLHDVGKIMIPDSILLKPGKLTQEEFEIMKTHSIRGCEILLSAPADWGLEYLRISTEIVRWHHEKYDGKGYPDGLAGDDIPISAQIVSVADCYDALINKRCYKDAFGFDKAHEMISNGECGAFSPELMKCFAKVKDDFESFAKDPNKSLDDLSQKTVINHTKLGGKQLLLIEDDELTREMTAGIIEDCGANVTRCENIIKALDILNLQEFQEFDAIILEMVMPDIEYPMAIGMIRESGVPGADTIPIFLLSPFSSEKDMNRALEAGASAYLLKPLTISALSKAVEQYT
ncbi:MAG: HD domain-containing protein [Lachnospiraceae bacterium]|nr:HD domain-containing protein [Lachnospiraceae bacterium]